MNESDFKDAVAEMMDITLLASEIDFESTELDFEEAKEIVISQSIPLIRGIIDHPDLSEQEKQIGIVATVGVVILENFYLNHSLLTLKREMKGV